MNNTEIKEFKKYVRETLVKKYNMTEVSLLLRTNAPHSAPCRGNAISFNSSSGKGIYSNCTIYGSSNL